jgi:hypothetical protein
VLGKSYKISAWEEHLYFNCPHLRSTLHIRSRLQTMGLNMNERGGNKGGPEARENQLEGLRQDK